MTDRIVDEVRIVEGENGQWRVRLGSDNNKLIFWSEQYGDLSWAEEVGYEMAGLRTEELPIQVIPYSKGGESMTDEVQGDKIEGDKVVQENPEPDTGNALNGEGEATDAETSNDEEDGS